MKEMMSKKTETTINVYANVTGSLWMPHEEIEFPVYKTFRHKAQTPFQLEWSGLRRSLLDIQNDGDYRNLDFVGEVEIVVERRFFYVDSETRRIKREVTRRKEFFITPENEEVSDLFA